MRELRLRCRPGLAVRAATAVVSATSVRLMSAPGVVEADRVARSRARTSASPQLPTSPRNGVRRSVHWGAKRLFGVLFGQGHGRLGRRRGLGLLSGRTAALVGGCGGELEAECGQIGRGPPGRRRCAIGVRVALVAVDDARVSCSASSLSAADSWAVKLDGAAPNRRCRPSGDVVARTLRIQPCSTAAAAHQPARRDR